MTASRDFVAVANGASDVYFERQPMIAKFNVCWHAPQVAQCEKALARPFRQWSRLLIRFLQGLRALETGNGVCGTAQKLFESLEEVRL
jgi:hypothetical protein